MLVFDKEKIYIYVSYMFMTEKDPFEKFLTRLIVIAVLGTAALISLVVLDMLKVF